VKILHLMLSCFYIDGYNYQENVLPRLNKEDGHSVRIIASTETYIDNQNLGYVAPRTYQNEDGIEVTRLPYRGGLPQVVMRKLRAYPGLYSHIEAFAPDVILFHGVPAYELLTVARYKKYHPSVKLYVDSHEDHHNSGTNALSKWVLHRGFYKSVIARALPSIDKILYISEETKDFLIENYDIPSEMMEFYPLGGVIAEESEVERRRQARRGELGLDGEDILFLHSGKLDPIKRTEALLEAFTAVDDARFRLVLIGTIGNEIREKLDPLIQRDPRITFLGWKTSSELQEYLCACDLYVQPGGQSATMQNAMCASAPVMIFPHKSHKPYLDGNGFFVEGVEDMKRSFQEISREPGLLAPMRRRSRELAQDLLDYRMLAARLYR